jgi:probable HAF family extracellular repeat protein
VALVALVHFGSAALAVDYKFTDLGAGSATDINNLGWVVGNVSDGNPFGSSSAFVYDGTNTHALSFDVQLSPGGPSQTVAAFTANGINDQGWITGGANVGGSRIPYLFNPAGSRLLGDLAGMDGLGLSGIGWVVGGTPGSGFVANGVTGTTLGLDPSQPLRSVNDAGVAVGGNGTPIQWSNGTVKALDFSSAATAERGQVFRGTAFGINSKGAIVGWVSFDKQPDQSRAFLIANGQVTILPTFGGPYDVANDVNALGDVVGRWFSPGGGNHATLYQAGQLIDLNAHTQLPAGWVLTQATAINDLGQIVGQVSTGAGPATHAFLLTPVVAGPPHITRKPIGGTATSGSNFSLDVGVEGSFPMTFRWQREEVDIPGATSAALTITNIQSAQAGNYRVIIHNNDGTATSDPVKVNVDITSNLQAGLLFGLTLRGNVGSVYRIEYAYRAAQGVPMLWTPLVTITLAASPTLWVDPDSLNDHGRLYRSVLVQP